MKDECAKCGRPARWRFTEVVGGRRSSRPLCEACAEGEGLRPPSVSSPSQPAGASGPAAPRQRPASAAEHRCPACGTPLSALRHQGRLGCPECYEAFRRPLKPLLRRLHGAIEHRGQRPHGSPGTQEGPDA